jgi:hypothetical protein
MHSFEMGTSFVYCLVHMAFFARLATLERKGGRSDLVCFHEVLVQWADQMVVSRSLVVIVHDRRRTLTRSVKLGDLPNVLEDQSL